MTIKVMLWNPPNAFNMGHMSIQTEEYYLSFWPFGDYKKTGGWTAPVEKPVDASLIIHLERDIELEGCEPDEVFEIAENVLGPYVNRVIKLFLLDNDIDPDSIKLHRVEERNEELERFIELIRSSPSHWELGEDPQTYANYVKFRRGYKTNPDDGVDLHDEMNDVIESIRGSTDSNSIIRKRWFPSEVPLLKTKYTVFVMSESFPRIVWEDLRRSRHETEYSMRLLQSFSSNGSLEPNDVQLDQMNDIHMPDSVNCITFVLFLLITADRNNEYPFWLIFSERGLFGFLNHIPSWASPYFGNNNRFFVIPLLQFILIFLPLINLDPSAVDYRFYKFQLVISENRKFLFTMLVLILLSMLVMSFCSFSWIVLICLRLLGGIIDVDDNFLCKSTSFLKGYGPYFVSYIILSLTTFTFLVLCSIFANKGPRYSHLSNPPEISKETLTLLLMVALIAPPYIPFFALVMFIFPSTFLYFFGCVLSGLFMCIRHFHFNLQPSGWNFYSYQTFRSERGYLFENNGLLNGIKVLESDDDDELYADDADL